MVPEDEDEDDEDEDGGIGAKVSNNGFGGREDYVVPDEEDEDDDEDDVSTTRRVFGGGVDYAVPNEDSEGWFYGMGYDLVESVLFGRSSLSISLGLV